jgi:hypothetical protein
MPIDVQLSILTTGGLEEPRADWTAAAEKHVHEALKSVLKAKKDLVVLYEPPRNDPEKARVVDQLIKLHETVGQAITVHKFIRIYNLPTKKDKFDWSLGSAARRLAERHDADCALFIFIRDSYASAGRKAAIVFTDLAAGLPPGFSFHYQGGRQLGFSSLIDLRNGNIIWFSRLDSAFGDLRTPEHAQEAIEELLDGIPL